MLWKTLITRINTFVHQHPTHAGPTEIRRLAWKANRDVVDYLLQTPPQFISTLRDLVPKAFPRDLQDGELLVDQNIHGAWRVNSKTSSKVFLARSKKS